MHVYSYLEYEQIKLAGIYSALPENSSPIIKNVVILFPVAKAVDFL